MLSDREQRILQELEASLADGGDGRRAIRRPAQRPGWLGNGLGVPAMLIVVGSVSSFLIIAGAASGGLALAVAGGLGWLLWRYWPQLRDEGMAVQLTSGAWGSGATHPPTWGTRQSSNPPRRADR
jgi:hypothetical protein